MSNLGEPPEPMVPRVGDVVTGMAAPIDPQVVPPSRRRRGWLVVASVLAASTAVGGVVVLTRSDSDASYSLSAAVAVAANVPDVEVEMIVTSSEVGSLVATARVDTVGQRMELSTVVPDLGEMRVLMDVAAGVMFIDSQGLELPPEEVPPTRYVSIDLGAGGTGVLLGEVTGPLESHPLAVTRAFDEENAEDLGLEEFRGERLKRYRVTIDLDALLVEVPGFDDYYGTSGDGAPAEQVFDVWITADNLLRRLQYEVVVLGETTTYDLVFATVENVGPIVLPDPSEVTDLSDWNAD